MVNGTRQQRDTANGHLSVLSFERYTLDLAEFGDVPARRATASPTSATRASSCSRRRRPAGDGRHARFFVELNLRLAGPADRARRWRCCRSCACCPANSTGAAKPGACCSRSALAFLFEFVDIGLKDLRGRSDRCDPASLCQRAACRIAAAAVVLVARRGGDLRSRLIPRPARLGRRMSPWKTLFRYIARQFFGWCGGVFLAMLERRLSARLHRAHPPRRHQARRHADGPLRDGGAEAALHGAADHAVRHPVRDDDGVLAPDAEQRAGGGARRRRLGLAVPGAAPCRRLSHRRAGGHRVQPDRLGDAGELRAARGPRSAQRRRSAHPVADRPVAPAERRRRQSFDRPCRPLPRRRAGRCAG